jgi:hypothetical protein
MRPETKVTKRRDAFGWLETAMRRGASPKSRPMSPVELVGLRPSVNDSAKLNAPLCLDFFAP